MLFGASQDSFRVDPQFHGLVHAAGLTARGVFADPRIKVWRKLHERENATLDVPFEGRTVRLHIKRYIATAELRLPHLAEVRGNLAMQLEKIPTAPMVGYGKLTDRRCFTIFLDLAGYTPADQLLAAGSPFEPLLLPTADLAAQLHTAGLHHRDLYLCHFMAKLDRAAVDLKLIDVARVGRLNSFLTRRRWVIKDLAQFWYSTTKHSSITDHQRQRWLARYAEQRGVNADRLGGAVQRKSIAISKHDAHLKVKQPGRDVSLPPLPTR